MAGYDIPREICPLEKRISDFSVSCGYDPMTVFNDFLTFVIHGFSPGVEKPLNFDPFGHAELSLFAKI